MGDNFHYFLAGMKVISSYAWRCFKKILFCAWVLYVIAASIVAFIGLIQPKPISESLEIVVLVFPGFAFILLLIAYRAFKGIARLGEERIRDESRKEWREKAVGKW